MENNEELNVTEVAAEETVVEETAVETEAQTISSPFLEKQACPLALHSFNTPFLPVESVTRTI